MWTLLGDVDAGKKVTKPYSINCNPFSRAMVSPLSTENRMPEKNPWGQKPLGSNLKIETLGVKPQNRK